MTTVLWNSWILVLQFNLWLVESYRDVRGKCLLVQHKLAQFRFMLGNPCLALFNKNLSENKENDKVVHSENTSISTLCEKWQHSVSFTGKIAYFDFRFFDRSDT